MFNLSSFPIETSTRHKITSAFSGPHRVQVVLALVVAAVLIVGAVVATPLAQQPLPPVPGFLGASGSSLIVINLLLASLLFSRGGLDGQESAVRLGTAYFFAASMQIPWLASFPGAFVPTALLGSGTSAVWLWCFLHSGFTLAIIRYALYDARARTSVTRSIMVCIAASVMLTMIGVLGLPWLPSMLADGHTLFTGFGAFVPPALLVIVCVALALVLQRVGESTARLWVAVGLVAEFFDIWLISHGAIRYTLGWYLGQVGGLFTSLVVLIAALHDITVLYRNAAAANDMLASQALMDGLTGVANRRRLDETVSVEWRRANRTGLPLSLIMIDVDFFKRFNDTYGHLAGDDCLRQVAAVLRTTIRRPADLVARYGGEEFVVLLPATDSLGAAEVADAIHRRLRGLALPHHTSPFGCVTVSCGIATAQPQADETYQELLAEADQNLYRAKQSGRNKSCSETTVACVTHEVSPSLL